MIAAAAAADFVTRGAAVRHEIRSTAEPIPGPVGTYRRALSQTDVGKAGDFVVARLLPFGRKQTDRAARQWRLRLVAMI